MLDRKAGDLAGPERRDWAIISETFKMARQGETAAGGLSEGAAHPQLRMM